MKDYKEHLRDTKLSKMPDINDETEIERNQKKLKKSKKKNWLVLRNFDATKDQFARLFKTKSPMIEGRYETEDQAKQARDTFEKTYLARANSSAYPNDYAFTVMSKKDFDKKKDESPS